MDAFLPIYLISLAVSLAVLYVIIRVGVKHGTSDALRAHEMWTRDGSLEAAIDEHAAKSVDREEHARAARQQLQRERS